MGLSIQFVSGSAPCWVAGKLLHLQKKFWRGLVKNKLIIRLNDLMRVGVIHWDMQIILLS